MTFSLEDSSQPARGKIGVAPLARLIQHAGGRWGLISALPNACGITLRTYSHEMAWGNVPEWLAAVGTLGAFGVALWLLGRQLATYRASEDDRKLRDARRVATWWEEFRDPNSNFKVRANVRNAGESPIYDTAVFLGPAVGTEGRPPPDKVTLHFGTVAPGNTSTIAIEASMVELDIETEVSDEDGFFRGGWIEVVFTDSAGRYWRRDRKGQLIERKDRSMDS